MNPFAILLGIDTLLAQARDLLNCVNIYIYKYVYVLSAVQISEDIHSFNATDLFRMAKDYHTHQVI